MKKRILSLFLAIIMTAVLLPTAVFATDGYSGDCGESLSWSLNADTGVLTISGTGAMTDYQTSLYDNVAPWAHLAAEIKSVVIESGVTTIGDYAFYGLVYLTSVTFGDTVTSIGAGAFCLCSLTEIDLPAGLTSIGASAFKHCSISEIELPEGLITLSAGAFSYNPVEYVDFPDGITVVPSAFAYCHDLKNVEFAPNTTVIGTDAFRDCISLVDVDIPDTVTHINDNAFYGCVSLTEIVIPENVIRLETNVFYGCTGLRKATILSLGRGEYNKWNDAGTGIFEYCTSLESVYFGKDVQVLGMDMFKDCTSLRTVEFHQELDLLCNEGGAFKNCSSLVKIELPPLELALNHEFDGCSSLETIVFTDLNDTSWGFDSFTGCTSLTSVYFCGNKPKFANGTDVSTDCRAKVTFYYPLGDSSWDTVAEKGFYMGAVAKPWTGILSESVVNSITAAGQTLVIVTSDASGEPVENAVISVNGSDYITSPEGSAFFPGEFEKFSVSAAGHTSQSVDFDANLNGVYHVTLKGDPNALKMAKMKVGSKSIDLLSQVFSANISHGDETFTIDVATVAENDNIGKYQLYAGKLKVAEIEAPLTTFTIKYGDLPETNSMTIKVVAKDGSTLSVNPIYLRAEKRGGWETSMKLFSGWKIEIDSDAPFFKGLELNIPGLPSFPFIVEYADECIRLGINLDFTKLSKNDWALLNTLYEGNVKDILTMYFPEEFEPKKKNVDFDFKLIGYGEVAYGVSKASINCYAVVGFSAYGEWQPLAAIPAVVELSFEAEGKLGSTIAIRFDQKVVEMSQDIELKAAVGAYLGAGQAYTFSAGIYGKAESTFLFRASTYGDDGVKWWYIDGNFGFKVKALGHDLVTVPLLETGKYYFYPKNGVGTDTNPVSLAYAAAQQEENYVPIASGASPMMFSRLRSGSQNALPLITTNGYIGMEKQTVALGEDIMMVYTDIDPARQGINVSTLYYTVYDTSAGTWSTPAKIADDLTADFMPQVYSSGDTVYVTWLNSKQVFAAYPGSIDDLAETLEVCVAAYSNGSFSTPTTLTNNDVFENSPKIVESNGNIYVLWSENSLGNIFSVGGTNTLKLATYANGSWSVSDAGSTTATLTGTALTVLDGQVVWGFTTDSDGDLTTNEDKALSVGNGALSATKVSGIKADVLNGKNVLTWYQDGVIMYTENGTTAVALTAANSFFPTPEYDLVDTSTHTAVIYSLSIDGEAEMYALVYDKTAGTWGSAVALTDAGKYIETIDALAVGNKVMTTFISRTVDLENDIESLTLNHTAFEFTPNVTADRAYILQYDIENAPIKLYIEATNNGTAAISSMPVTVTGSDGTVYYSGTVSKNIVSGGTATLELEITPKLALETYTVTVGTSSTQLQIGLPDLKVSAESRIAGGKHTVVMTVENTGYGTAGGTIELIHENGVEIFTETVSSLAHGDKQVLTVELDEKIFADGSEHTFEVKVTTTAEQTTTANDSVFVTAVPAIAMPASTDSTVSISADMDTTYNGSAVSDPTVSTTGSTGTVVFEYFTDKDCTIPTTSINSGAVGEGKAPVKAGTYYVKATLPADAFYDSASAVQKFTISPKAVTVSGVTVKTKTYDGTTAAVVDNAGYVNGAEGSDNITVTAGTAAFETASAGTNKTVLLTGFTLSGDDAGNYTLKEQPTGVTGTIEQATVTITASDAAAKTGSTLPQMEYAVTGLAQGESLAQAPGFKFLKDSQEATLDLTQEGTWEIQAYGAQVPSGGNYKPDITYVSGTLTVTRGDTPAIIIPTVPDTDDGNNGGSTAFTPFIDVKESDWFFSSVEYVSRHGLMNGVGSGFDPDGSMTRAMLMTVLARMDGVDTSGGQTWYQKGLEWAVATGVSDGSDPMGTITREQLVTMLYRYAGAPAATGSLDAFADGDEVSSWAIEAMVWAVENGIVNGMGGMLNPQGTATRAQVATMIQRFHALVTTV